MPRAFLIRHRRFLDNDDTNTDESTDNILGKFNLK